MTDYSATTPYSTVGQVELITTKMGKDISKPTLREYLRKAHAEIAQLLNDSYGIDPSTIVVGFSGYGLIQAAEADVAAGLWEEDTPELTSPEYRDKRSIKYIRGMKQVHEWATHQNENRSPGTTVFRTKNQISARREYLNDHY